MVIKRILNKPFRNMVKLIAFLLLIKLGFLFSVLFAQNETVIVDTSTTVQEIDGKEYYLHEVLRGETLYSISRAYGVAVEAILQENPDLEHGLRYDQVIKIPILHQTETPRQLSVHAPEPEGEYLEHKVSRRETLFGLSQRYGVPIEMILYYNPVARGGLKVGQLLRIPVLEDIEEPQHYSETLDDPYSLDPERTISYTVVTGDTKYGISRRIGISIEELESLNPGIKDGLQAGQEIQIPVSADSPEPVAQTPESDQDEEFITISHESVKPYETMRIADCFKPELKDSYNVALLIPFYLEELVPEQDSLLPDEPVFLPDSIITGFKTDNDYVNNWKEYWKGGVSVDHKSFTFISYYQGVLLALDSIKQQGVNIKLHVYDVCSQVRKAGRLITAGKLDDMDLIIGPFHRHALDIIAAYGLEHDIPVVSPLLPDRHQIEGFPNLFKIITPLETMLQGVADYISQNYPQQNILIVHNNQPGAAQIISAFKDNLLTEVARMNYFYDSLNLSRINGYFFDETLVGSRQTNLLVMPDTVSVMMPVRSFRNEEIRVPKPYNVQEIIYREVGMDGLKKKLRIDRENVLVTLISGEPFLSDYLRQLHKLRHEYDISIFGIPEWQGYSSIEFDYLQNLKVHIFVPFFYDYSEPYIRDFVLRYRKMFQTEPDNEAFKAAQTAYFFFEALAMYGQSFEQCIPYLNSAGFESPFSFGRPFGELHGWENEHFNIFRIEGYRRIDVQKPVEFEISKN